VGEGAVKIYRLKTLIRSFIHLLKLNSFIHYFISNFLAAKYFAKPCWSSII